MLTCADRVPAQVAWITFVKQKGLSPLQPGQWPAFLAFYAGAAPAATASCPDVIAVEVTRYLEHAFPCTAYRALYEVSKSLGSRESRLRTNTLGLCGENSRAEYQILKKIGSLLFFCS